FLATPDLLRPDIAMQSTSVALDNAIPHLRRIVDFDYTVQGSVAQPFQVQVYRSAKQTFDPIDLANGATFSVGSPVLLSGNGLTVGPHSGEITLPAQLDFDPQHPYVLVVADPGQQIT